jgi:hypothetical protein
MSLRDQRFVLVEAIRIQYQVLNSIHYKEKLAKILFKQIIPI